MYTQIDDLITVLRHEHISIPLLNQEQIDIVEKATSFIYKFIYIEISQEDKLRTKFINHFLFQLIGKILIDDEQTKFSLFSFHDFNLIYLLNGLGFLITNDLIDFCSFICIELYENIDTKSKLIKVCLNDNYFMNNFLLENKENNYLQNSGFIKFEIFQEMLKNGCLESDEEYLINFGENIKYKEYLSENWKGYVQDKKGKPIS